MKASGNTSSGVARARWLAELAQAIDEAQCLAWRLGVIEGRRPALELYVRLDIARAEVEAMRGRRRRDDGPGDAHPPSDAFPTREPAEVEEA